MQLELLDLFETPEPVVPPRSRLISLDPREARSAFREALISYLTRLAGAHVVRPNVLVNEIIIPLTNIRLETYRTNFNAQYARTINSYTKYAKEVSQALETLTFQTDLRHLTFLPWGDLLDPKGSRLLRDHVGVCDKCLDELDSSEDGIYYPLIWYLRPARICSKHQRWLRETCPACGKSQNFVAHHAMLGYCTQCGGWLGSPAVEDHELTDSRPISIHDQFIVLALEQMIAHNESAGAFASHERFVERLELYADVLTKGNMKAFEIRLGFQKNVVVNWLDKRSRPRIDMFLELCFRLGQMPVEFMTSDIPEDFPNRIGYFERTRASSRRKLSDNERAAMKSRLEEILDCQDAPTQLAVAEKLGVSRRFLNHHFTKLARQISDKHKRVQAERTSAKQAQKAQITKSVTESMLNELRPISNRKIGMELRKEGQILADPATRKVVREVLDEHARRPFAQSK